MPISLLVFRLSPGDVVMWEGVQALVLGAAKHRLWFQFKDSGTVHATTEIDLLNNTSMLFFCSSFSGLITGCTRQTLNQLVGKGCLYVFSKHRGKFEPESSPKRRSSSLQIVTAEVPRAPEAKEVFNNASDFFDHLLHSKTVPWSDHHDNLLVEVGYI